MPLEVTENQRQGPSNWDIGRGVLEDGLAGASAHAEHFPALALPLALDAQLEFWSHVATIRSGDETAAALARRYVRRDQGRRCELIATYLARAAAAPTRSAARLQLYGTATYAYFVDAEPGPGAPQRTLRADARATLTIGAIRVARRGAGRCVAYDCSAGSGAKLAQHGAARDYCSPCAAKDPLGRLAKAAAEAERALFTGAVAVVLHDEEESRPRARRRQRRTT